jgi:hypothetical protein
MNRRLTALVALGITAASAQARAEFYDVNRLYHRIGQYSAGWWRAAVNTDMCSLFGCPPVVASTYGPYATSLPPGDALAITSFGAFPNTNKMLRWQMEVYDAAHSQTLKTASYAQPYSPSGTGQHYSTVLPFVVTNGQNVEVRTWHYGNGTLDQCGVHILNERDNKIQDVDPVRDQLHRIGYNVNRTWENETAWEGWCDPQTADCTSAGGYLTYGPYWNLFNDRTATVVALFNVQIGYGTYSSAPIAELTVTASDNGVRKQLAVRQLYASDFPAGGWVDTKFPLKFDVLPQYTSYEYRVYWFGYIGFRVKHTKIFDPKSNACMW